MKNSMEITLSELPLNSLGYISKINCNENIKRRLLDLGLIENSKIIPVLVSPFGNSISNVISFASLAIVPAKFMYINIFPLVL